MTTILFGQLYDYLIPCKYESQAFISVRMLDFLPTPDLFWLQHRTPQFVCGIIKPPDVSRHIPVMWTERIAFQHALLQWKDHTSLVEAKIVKYIFGTCRLVKYYKYLKVIVVNLLFTVIIPTGSWLLLLEDIVLAVAVSFAYLSPITTQLSLFRHILLKTSLHLRAWIKIWLFVFGLTNKTLMYIM